MILNSKNNELQINQALIEIKCGKIQVRKKEMALMDGVVCAET